MAEAEVLLNVSGLKKHFGGLHVMLLRDPYSMFASLLSGDCWPLRLITSRILVQSSRQSPLSLRYWCLMASTKRCWCWRDIC